MNTKRLISYTLTAITCLGFSANQVQGATFNFSGFSISDSINSYEAEGSFDLADDFSGRFSLADIFTTLTINLTTVFGTPADFTFNSSNINLGSSTFTGTATGQTATFDTISIFAMTTFAQPVILGDGVSGQSYINNASGVILDSRNGGVSGTPFNDATAESIPEPVSLLGSLAALGFGVLFKKV